MDAIDNTVPAPAPGFRDHPDYSITIDAHAGHVRAIFAGQIIAETDRAVLLQEENHSPVYYLPLDDFQRAFLRPSDHTTYCPFKGTASYFAITANGRTSENTIWHYPAPYAEVFAIKGFAAFYVDRLDALEMGPRHG